MSTPIVPAPKPIHEDAIKRYAASNRARQVKPQYPQAPPSEYSDQWENARTKQREELDKFDWDPLWRPVEHGLNILFSAGVGVVNTFDKGIGLIKPLEENETYWDKIGDFTTAFGSGMGAALTNNTDSENYVLGNDLIENASDAIGGRFNPDYKDVDDNVNPWVKGIGGFVLDVALDPITYTPAGLVAAVVKGGVRGAAGAKGLGRIKAGVKGFKKGTASTDYKFGRWSGAIKPVGYEQWSATRSLDTVDRIAKKARIDPDKARFLAPTEMAKSGKTYEQAAQRLNDDGAEALLRYEGDPKSLAAAQKNIRTDWTAQSVEALGRKVEPLSKDINEFANARSLGHKIGANKRRLTMQAKASGVSAYMRRGMRERNSVIFEEEHMIKVEKGLQAAFYASMGDTVAMADEVTDPIMQATRDEIASGLTSPVPYTGTQADEAMIRIDKIFGAEQDGTTKFYVDTHRRITAETGTDFTVKGVDGNTYSFLQVMDAAFKGTNIGLTKNDASVFGRVLAEYLALAHEVRPVKVGTPPEAPVAKAATEAPVAPAAAKATEAPAPAEATTAPPKQASPEEMVDDGTSPDVSPDYFGPEKPPATVKQLWEEATINADKTILREINAETDILNKHIDAIYTTKVKIGDYGRNSSGEMKPYIAGMVGTEKGVLSQLVRNAGIEYVIDTRPIPRVLDMAGPLAHLDKSLLRNTFEAGGIGYGTMSEARAGVPLNTAMYSPHFGSYKEAMQNPEFAQGIEDIIAQMGGAKKAILLVFEGTGTYNDKMKIVAEALTKRGIRSKLVLQKGLPQGRETLELIAGPMEAKTLATRTMYQNLTGQYEGGSPEEALMAAKTILRASGERQAEGPLGIAEREIKEEWVANVKNMMVANAKGYETSAEEIVQRSNILTNLLSSHQWERADLVQRMLSVAGGGKSVNSLTMIGPDVFTMPPKNVETFFRAVFGSKRPVAESFVTEDASITQGWEGAQYVVNDHEIVLEVINLLAGLRTRIPGYTDKARGVLGRITDEKMLNASRPLDVSAIEKVKGETISPEMGWVASNYGQAFLKNPDTTTIDIFGEVVEGGDAEVAYKMKQAIQSIGEEFLADAEAPPLLASEKTAYEFALDAMKVPEPTANLQGTNVPIMRGTLRNIHKDKDLKYGKPNTPMQQRWVVGMPLGKSDEASKLRAELGTPWQSPALDRIYDHVSGFAKAPLNVSGWMRALNETAKHAYPWELKNMAIQKLKEIKDYGFQETYTQYFNALKDLEPDASKNYGLDIFGRVFRDLSPQRKGSTYAAYRKINKETPAMKEELWKMSLKHESFDEGIRNTDLDAFAEDLAQKYGETRQQELMPFIRAIEAERTKEQAIEIATTINKNMGDEMAEIKAQMADDPLYMPISLLDSLPEGTRAIVAKAMARTSISNVRKAATNVDKPAVLKWFAEIVASRKEVSYEIVPQVKRYNEKEVAAALRKLGDVNVAKKIFELLKSGEVVSAMSIGMGSTFDIIPLYADGMGGVARGGNTARKLADNTKPFGKKLALGKGAPNPKKKGPNNLNDQANRIVHGDDQASTGQYSMKETMDLVRAEDLGEAFWTGIGGDQWVKWNPMEDPDVDAFIDGVTQLLGLETRRGIKREAQRTGKDVVPWGSPGSVGSWYQVEEGESARGLVAEALAAASRLAEPEAPPGRFVDGEGTLRGDPLPPQGQIGSAETGVVARREQTQSIDPGEGGYVYSPGDFRYSDFVVELASLIRSSKTSGIGVKATDAQVEEVILNGGKIEGFTLKMLKEGARVTSAEELIEAVVTPNPYAPVNPESTLAVMSVLNNINASKATMIPDHIRRKKVAGLFTDAQAQMLKTVQGINDFTVPHGAGIAAKTEEIGEEGIAQYVAGNAQRAFNRIEMVRDVAGRNLIHNAATDGVQASLRNMDARDIEASKKGFNNARVREFTEDDEIKMFINIKGTIESRFKPGSAESWKAQQMARAEAKALLNQAGVFQVTTLPSGQMGNRRFKVDFKKGHHWGYIDFMDTYRAIVAGDPDFDALMREAMEIQMVGKKHFPSTLIPKLGVYANNLHVAGVGETEMVVLLHDYAKTALNNMGPYITRDGKRTKTFSHRGWADAVNMFQGESFANGFVSKLVSRLADKKVGQKLMQTHLTNGAAALKVAETNSRKIVQPVFEKLMLVGKAVNRSYGAKSDAIDESIDELRTALSSQGYLQGSPEALISNQSLQKLQSDLFSPMDMNAARTAHRMKRVTHLAADGETPLTPTEIAARIAAVEARAMPESMRKLQRALTAAKAKGNAFATAEATTNLRRGAAALKVRQRLRIEKMRGPQNEERARLASESLNSAREIAVEDVVRTAQKAVETDDGELFAMAYEKSINIGEHINRTNELLQESFRGGRARFDAENTAATAEAKAASGVPTETYDEAINATPDDERKLLARSATNNGGPENVSGGWGLAEVKGTAAGVEARYDGDNNVGEKAVDAAIAKVQKIMGDKKGPKAEAWHSELVRATFGQNRYNFVQQQAHPELRQIAGELIKAWKVILDTGESSLFSRSGLDTNYINTFLGKGPMGTTDGAGNTASISDSQLTPNLMGWEIEATLPRWIDNLLSPDGGKRSALQAFKGISLALHEAAKVPSIAAQFSAQFGHRSWGYISVAEAKLDGFVQLKIGDDAGTLGRWLDGSQAYPPEMVRQMANLERFLDYDTRFKNPTIKKIMTAVDKVTSFMKSSLTIWRPGHHVVSAVGDVQMNLLDGVVNPYRYYQAGRVLRANGQFHQGTVFGRDKGAEFGRFMGEYDDAVGGSKGINVQIGGVNRTLSDIGFYKMLDDAGALINNNTAEDLIAIGDEISLSGGKLAKLFRPVVRANRGLGEFSARRDNFLRLAHAIDLVQRRSFRSTQELQDHVVREIMAWHPTLQSLSGFERKYMRRMFYFYTWMRNATNKVFETILEDPRYLTVVPKANVGISVGMGGEPQSVGQTMPNDSRLPEFAARNILGPSWYDDEGNVVGITVNAPQLDIFQDLLGKIAVDPNATFIQNFTENAMLVVQENTIGFLSPGPKFVGEFLTQQEYKEYGMTPIRDWQEHLVDQTGFGIISRSAGRSLINENGFLGARTDVEENPDEQVKKQIQTGLNSVTGLRWTEWSKWYDVARRERAERRKRYLENTMGKLLDEG